MSGLLDKLAVARGFHKPFRHVPAVYVLLGGVVLSCLVFGLVRRMEYHRIQADLDRAGAINLATLNHGLDTYLLKLESLAAFYAGSEEVTRAEFHEFVRPILRRGVDAHALAWVPRVPDWRRQEYEERARKQGFSDFAITDADRKPAPRRSEYFPLYFVEPYEGNEGLLGFDLGSAAPLLKTLDDARDGGMTTISPKMRILPEGPDGYDFLMVDPVYAKGSELDSVEHRRDNLDGFYAIIAGAGELLENLLTARPPRGIDVYIFDVSASEERQLLYFHSSRLRKAPIRPIYTHVTEWSGFTNEATIEIGGREWLVLSTPAPGFIVARRTWASWGILAGGIIFSILAAAYISVALTSAAAAKKFAADESRSKQQLQREIAVRKRAEKQREQLMRALADRNEEMSNLLDAVSHDLRAPLVNIGGFARELSADSAEAVKELAGAAIDPEIKERISKALTGRVTESVKFISASTEKMGKLLDGLRNLSRTGRVELIIERLDMNRLVQKVVNSVSFLIKEGGVSVTVEELPGCLGDAGQINQVFSNLLNNALKYLDPSRPGVITVSGRIEGERSIYCVRDNGIGIPADQHSRIFDIFYRVDPRGGVAGEGLGLTTVKQILTRHNGRIWVESEPGKGSAFFVSLPCAGACEGADEADTVGADERVELMG